MVTRRLTATRRQRRCSAVAVAASVLLALVSLAGSAPAVAGEPGVLVSSDGSHYSESAAGIFEGDGVLVPGDAVSASVWIKNSGATSAVMRVSIRELVTTSAEYAENVSLTVVEESTDVASTVPLAGLTDCAVLVRTTVVPLDGVLRVDLRLQMADVGGVTAQDDSSTIGLVVAMRDSAGESFPDSACDDDGAFVTTASDRYDAIASTGAEEPTALLLLGGLAVGSGAFLIGARRRKGKTE